MTKKVESKFWRRVDGWAFAAIVVVTIVAIAGNAYKSFDSIPDIDPLKPDPEPDPEPKITSASAETGATGSKTTPATPPPVVEPATPAPAVEAPAVEPLVAPVNAADSATVPEDKEIESKIQSLSKQLEEIRAKLLPFLGDLTVTVRPGEGAIAMYQDMGSTIVAQLRAHGISEADMRVLFPDGSPMHRLVEAKLSGTLGDEAHTLAVETGFYRPGDPRGLDSRLIPKNTTFIPGADGGIAYLEPGKDIQTLHASGSESKVVLGGTFIDTTAPAEVERGRIIEEVEQTKELNIAQANKYRTT